MIKHERDPGNFVTRIFEKIATGHKVKVIEDSEPDLYGVHGLGEEDLDVIMAERTRRRHDDLTRATVHGPGAAAAVAVVDDIAREKARPRRDKINEIVDLMREISAMARKRKRTK
jgi:hypothetical protein